MKIQKSHIFGVVLGLIPIMIIYFAYAIPPTFYDYANQCKSNLLFENKYNKDKEPDGQSQSLLVAYLLKFFLPRWNILLYRSSACHRSLSAISQNA